MYANPKPRPLVDDENHYEGRYINANPDYPVWNASNVRIGNWQSVSHYLPELIDLAYPTHSGFHRRFGFHVRRR